MDRRVPEQRLFPLASHLPEFESPVLNTCSVILCMLFIVITNRFIMIFS